MIRPLLLVAIAPLALAACGDDPAPVGTDDGGRAEGEVQGGTISDAMIPLDTLTSQSPPLERQPVTEGGGDTAEPADDATPAEPEANADEAGAEAPEAPAEPTPLATPAAE